MYKHLFTCSNYRNVASELDVGQYCKHGYSELRCSEGSETVKYVFFSEHTLSYFIVVVKYGCDEVKFTLI